MSSTPAAGFTDSFCKPLYAARWRLMQFVLPDANDPPASTTQPSPVSAVTGDVSRNLGIPVFSVRFRATVTLRTPMPEAAIHEQSDALCVKHKIGFTSKLLVAPPSGYLVCAKQFDQAQFSGRISTAPDAGHDSRPFSATENVHYKFVACGVPTLGLVSILRSSASNSAMIWAWLKESKMQTPPCILRNFANRRIRIRFSSPPVRRKSL